MFNIRKVAERGAIATISLIATASPVLFTQLSVKADTLPPVVTAYSSISVKVDGVSFEKLYNFTTDLHNDSLWFPNVASTLQTQDANKPGSKVGIEYIQVSSFNGIELDTNVKVVGDKHPLLFMIEGNGPVANYTALYTFTPSREGNAGVFTLTTKFASPGITKEILTFLLTQAMQNIISHFNTTGEVTLHYMVIQ